MPCLSDILDFLQKVAPLDLAESWDNVGLLLGRQNQDVHRVMTCLTLSPDVAEEAVSREVDLVVTHHPILFRSVQRLTDVTAEGKMLLDLASAGIAVFSAHTAFDSAAQGINQQLAEALALTRIVPLRATPEGECVTGDVGGGRAGELVNPEPLETFVERVKTALKIRHLQYVGNDSQNVKRVAVACGSAAEFLTDAIRLQCDVLLTGEARFHACVEARTKGVAMVLAGHYATERGGVEALAKQIGREFSGIEVFASERECDPIRWSPE